VTSVPSLRRPQLVTGFAKQLAAALQLPYAPVIQHLKQHPPQSTMHNSHQQVENVWNVFGVQGTVRAAPVLLVDDLADSRWTLTVIGDLLRQAGSGKVHPFVLATII
jgi:ATP-dependent DNA helicase RecQ